MTAKLLRELKTIRERREQRALVELQTRNRFRDSTSDALTRLSSHIQQENTAMRGEEARQYQGAVGRKLSVHDVTRMAFAMDQVRRRFGQLKDRGQQLQAIVQQAISDAAASKAEHAARYRAERKWARIVGDALEESQAEDDRAEELANEELGLVLKPRV